MNPASISVYNLTSMHPARIAELLDPFLADDRRLTTDDLHRISTYIDLLLRWNARINLTAIRDPESIVTRHFGESLFAARHLFPSSAASVAKDLDVDLANHQPRKTNDRLADLGSGAGFPGIPIKLWAPDISLTLIESNQKKATFLREVARALTLTNINIHNARAETLLPSTFDVVTLRAVERLADTLPIAAALLVPRGRLAVLISSRQADATRSRLPRFTWDTPIPIPQSQSRLVMIGTQESVK